MRIDEGVRMLRAAQPRPSKVRRVGTVFDLAALAFAGAVVVVVCGSIAATMAAFAWMAWQWASAGSGL